MNIIKLIITLGFFLIIRISFCFGQNDYCQYGLINCLGEIIIPFEYDEMGITGFSGNTCIRVGKNGFEGIMNTDGEILVPCEYDNIWSISEDVAGVSLDHKKGFVDMTSGKLIIPCIYKYADDFHEGLALIYKSGKSGFVDKEGRLVAFGKYDHCEYFHNGYAQVKKNEKWGFIDKEGNEVIPCIYDSQTDIYLFNDNGIAETRKREMDKEVFGLVNINREEVVPCIYDKVSIEYDKAYKNAAIVVKKDDKWGLLDAKGKEITHLEYDAVSFYDGYYIVNKDGKWGCVNVLGKEMLPCEYSEIDRSDSGHGCHCLLVTKEGKKGVYNLEMEKMTSPCIYESMGDFMEGFSKVKKNGELIYVDTNGKEYKYEYRGYDKIIHNDRGRNSLYGLQDAYGNQIVDYVYDYIEYVANDVFIVSKGGYKGLMNGKGELVVPLIYNSLRKWSDDFLIAKKIINVF